jgi:hypothetical protein
MIERRERKREREKGRRRDIEREGERVLICQSDARSYQLVYC